MSTRQSIITAIDARLRTITIANGYHTNAGAHVYGWLDRDLADSELDAIIYRDQTNDLTPMATRRYENVLMIEIEAKTKQASGTAKRLREINEDIYKAIGSDETFSGLARSARPVSERIEITQNDKVTGSSTIGISVVYELAKWEY